MLIVQITNMAVLSKKLHGPMVEIMSLLNFIFSIHHCYLFIAFLSTEFTEKIKQLPRNKVEKLKHCSHRFLTSFSEAVTIFVTELKEMV